MRIHVHEKKKRSGAVLICAHQRRPRDNEPTNNMWIPPGSATLSQSKIRSFSVSNMHEARVAWHVTLPASHHSILTQTASRSGAQLHKWRTFFTGYSKTSSKISKATNTLFQMPKRCHRREEGCEMKDYKGHSKHPRGCQLFIAETAEEEEVGWPTAEYDPRDQR